MIRMHIVKRVPAHRVEELLDRIWQIATNNGTFNITNLIDEYREDVFLVPINEKKERPHGRTHHPNEDLGAYDPEDRRRGRRHD